MNLPNHEDEADNLTLATLGYVRRMKATPQAHRTKGSCACLGDQTCEICIRDAAIRTAAFARGAQWREKHPK